VTAMKLYWGCADNAGAPNNSCLGAIVGAATWAMGAFVTSKGDKALQRGVWGKDLIPGSPFNGT
jgi:hypothetical protein